MDDFKSEKVDGFVGIRTIIAGFDPYRFSCTIQPMTLCAVPKQAKPAAAKPAETPTPGMRRPMPEAAESGRAGALPGITLRDIPVIGPNGGRSAPDAAGGVVQRKIIKVPKGGASASAWVWIRSDTHFDYYDDGKPDDDPMTDAGGVAAAGSAGAAPSRPATRATHPVLNPGIPLGASKSGGPAENLLPHENPTTPLQHLSNAAGMAKYSVGHFAPGTLSASMGWHTVTPTARDRQSNEQGKSLLKLHNASFAGASASAAGAPTPATSPSARKIIAQSGLPLLPGMTGPRELQSLHGVARSLGDRASGANPLNYGAGSRSANLQMQAFEKVLARPEMRGHMQMRTTFYHDPRAPIAHGISTEIRPIGAGANAVEYHLSGYQTTATQEQVKRERARIHAHLTHARHNPPQPVPSMADIQHAAPEANLDEQAAIAGMLKLSQTLVIGTNPWAAAARPLPAPAAMAHAMDEPDDDAGYDGDDESDDDGEPMSDD